jgi:hypothetical protein
MDVPGNDPGGVREIRVSADRLARWLAGFEERHGPVTVTTEPEVVALAAADAARAWLDVPFPPLVGDLVEHASQPRRVAVLLVRRGGYAVGVFAGDRLVTSKVGSSYVQGGTKAGGWSQQRYARRRANQADAAFAEAADVAARLLVPEALDALVAGGDRPAVRTVLADPRLAALPPVSPPWLQVKDPKLRVLAAAPAQFRSIRIRLVP